MQTISQTEFLLIEGRKVKKQLTAKIICIGDSFVGKTSIVCRYIQNHFKTDCQSTIGVEYFKKKIPIDEDDEIYLEIWDTAGQERYRSLVKFFYKNAKGALLVFDLCDRTSFLNLEFWLKSLRNNINKEIVIFLIGNKCDKLEEREVKEEEIKKFCEEKELQYFLTSAKENIEIKQVFLAMGRKIKKNIQNSIVVETSLLNSISSENYEMKNEKGCAICEC